jgi:cyanophycinase
VIATAAVRQDPDAAVGTARQWLAGLGLGIEELRLRTRHEARSDATCAAASRGSLFYLCGGDPGIVPTTLDRTSGWRAVIEAWQAGAALAGSSAGAMALGEWTLIRARMPGDARREPRPGLTVVPRVAVLPHYSDFGQRWVDSAMAGLTGKGAVLVGIDARTAAFWADGTWTAMGTGSVVVIEGDAERRYSSGETITGIPQPAGRDAGAANGAIDGRRSNPDNLGQD